MKNKKLSSKNDFEGVYLKANCAKKAFKKLSDNKINAALSNPNFTRCVKYCANSSFRKNKLKFLQYGFDVEDIYSMCLTYGLNFLTSPKIPKDKKSFAYLLMRYINQRLVLFCLTFERKFKTKEVVSEHKIDDVFLDEYLDDEGHLTGGNHAALYHTPETTVSVNLEDEITLLERKKSKLKSMKGLLTKQLNKPSLENKDTLRLSISKTERLINSTSKSLKEAKLTKTNQVQTNKKKKKELKAINSEQLKELTQNIDKYKDVLAYTATSRFVDYQARKKAREFCNKYAINYIEWAESQVKNGKDSSAFVY